ncbi:hypothetical protein JB92DRAFT_2676551, partial [Gautieria morchelliformis]
NLSASVIAVLQLTAATVNMLYVYGNSVKHASKDRKRIIDQLLMLQQVLNGVREAVEDASDASVELPTLTKLLESPSGLPRYRIELEKLKAKLETPSGRSDRLQALIWPLKEGDVKKTLEYLKNFQQLLSTTLNAGHLGVTVEIRTDVKHIRQDDRRRDIFKWLAAPDHHLSHTNAQKKRRPKTGLWFVHGETFKAWRDLPHSTLWLHGKMGSGKTILCSTLVDELFRPNGRDPLPAVAYFYFTNKQTGTNDALRSLINQLSLTMTSDIPAALESLYSQHSEGWQSQSLTLHTLISTLKSLIASVPHPYIVLDALEECQDGNELLQLIQEIHGFGSLHFLATSRDELDIMDVMSSLDPLRVPMDESHIQDDIHLHIHQTIYYDQRYQKWLLEVKEKVETTLMNGAHGMTLYETYDKILLNIQEEDRQYALKVLQWLAFSVRPISLAETVEILATNPQAAGACLFNPNERLLNPREVLIICSSLVTISEENTAEEETGRYLPTTTNQEQVRLAHFSVKEYLVSGHVWGGCASIFYFNQHMADTFISETCLAYLLQFDHHQPFYNDGIRCLNYPLSQYAAQHWPQHARSTGCSSDTLQSLIMALLHSKNTMYTKWIKLHDPDVGTRFFTDPMGHPLYYTSLTGLEIPSQLLLDSGAEVNAHGGSLGSALQAAASKGYREIVQLLLEWGGDVNAVGGYYGNALQAAASNCHLEVIRRLLEHGA